MAYCTYNDMILRYPSLSDYGTQASDVTNDLIYYAEMEINSRLGTHFTVPFTTVYPTIKDLTIDLAYYRVYRLKDPDKAEKMKESILGRIEDLKTGKEALYTGSGVVFPALKDPDPQIWSSTQDYHSAFSMLDAESPFSQVSSQQLNDLAGER